MPSRHALSFLALAACFVSTAAVAMTKDLDEAANDPTYEPKKVLCEGGSCKAFVINHEGMGVVVKGKNKKKTKEKAQKKADELNEEAKENSVSTEEDGVFDTCKMFPETC